MSSETKQEYFIDRKKQQEDMKARMSAYQKECRSLSHPATRRRSAHKAARKE